MSLSTAANGRERDAGDAPPDPHNARSAGGSRSKTSPTVSVVRRGSTRGPNASERVVVRSTPTTEPAPRSDATWVHAPGWHPRSRTASPARITPKRSWISFSFSADLAAYPSFFASRAKKSAVLRDPIVAPTARPDRLAFSWLCSLLVVFAAAGRVSGGRRGVRGE